LGATIPPVLAFDWPSWRGRKQMHRVWSKISSRDHVSKKFLAVTINSFTGLRRSAYLLRVVFQHVKKIL
jgi:hypothetical protein